ncbi:MAG: CcmD family protein [Melioribacter sp.]|nr:CcmD family protein [Melioribacter sp.]
MENGLINFLEQNSIYIVMFIVLVVWIGIFLFLLNTDKRLKELEKEIKEK